MEVEGEGKGHSFSQPQLCCCCKNIKVLLHCASQQDSPASAFDGCVSRPQHNALIFGESQWIQRGCGRLINFMYSWVQNDFFFFFVSILL